MLSFIVGFVLVVVVFASLAPRPLHKAVPLSSFKPIGGNPCGTFGSVVTATLTDDAGPYRLYAVTCSDGVKLSVAGA